MRFTPSRRLGRAMTTAKTMSKKLGCLAACATFTMVLTACAPVGEETTAGAPESTETHADGEWSGETVDVVDNEGAKTVPFKPERVVAFDPRMAALLKDLGIDAIVATSPEEAADAEPDMVLVGAETSHSASELQDVAGAPVVDLTPRPDPPLDWEMVRQVQVLGVIFDKEEEAEQMDSDFSDALERARNAVGEDWSATAVEASGEAAEPLPADGGKLWGPVMDMVGLKPVELNEEPDVILVEEREPDMRSSDYVPALKLLLDDKELAETPAVENVNIYVGPFDVPEVAGASTYTLILNELADHWSISG